jgi:hypothetical protein
VLQAFLGDFAYKKRSTCSLYLVKLIWSCLGIQISFTSEGGGVSLNYELCSF